MARRLVVANGLSGAAAYELSKTYTDTSISGITGPDSYYVFASNNAILSLPDEITETSESYITKYTLTIPTLSLNYMGGDNLVFAAQLKNSNASYYSRLRLYNSTTSVEIATLSRQASSYAEVTKTFPLSDLNNTDTFVIQQSVLFGGTGYAKDIEIRGFIAEMVNSSIEITGG